MKKFTNEIKIGLFVVLALCVAIFMWAKTQNFVASATYNLKTYFNYAGGLKENATVTLAGIEVGRIEEINFKYEPETKIELILSIDKDAKLHSDAIAYIDASGFIGQTFIGLTPGTAGSPFVKDGDTIGSEDPVQMRELMKRVDNVSRNVDETLENNKEKVDNMMTNFEETSVNFNEFSADIKEHPWKLLVKGKEKKKK